ncbi:CDGSH iron-sulfur domain-containing protein [Gordonia sp. L191]|uniref:CDGSH iron-sulfur domain-containing protein n=1 Tax=Gordonia sp. L191 TaxID=2982699 RepID=UPI0024BFB5AF|nr:CDGSH iron-sulfur domain-containing protein [Gordonia sp. L191]WHU47508.1 CDGSH iron-sulfur domain-containing protein [Gordonia sp. L191]
MANLKSGSHHVDRRNPARITVTPAGPLVVRGDVEIVDTEGNPIPRRRATVALCRCGRSGIQPYCDGSHAIGRSPIRGE